MERIICLIVLLALGVHFSSAATAAQWKSRTIYQLLTDRFGKNNSDTSPCPNLGQYCGGSFKGIINHLDYILGLGMDAIWISPVVVNYPGGYHGYWATDIFNINPNFGTSQDLQALVSACHEKGIYVMLDVVANHMGPVGTNYTGVKPFNDPSHYHNCNQCPSGCSINNYEDTTQIEICRLAGLPDLNQTVPFVASTILKWIQNITSFYNIDGIRIDTIPEVAGSPSSSLAPFLSQFQQSAGMYAVGEVFDGRVSYVSSYQGIINAVLSYPLAFQLRSSFQSANSLYNLQNILQQYNSSFKDPSILGTFVDNHDNPRFLNGQPDVTLYQNALLYNLLGEGIPIIYYGSEQGFNGGADPNNREPLWTSKYNTQSQLYQFISLVTNYRKKAQVWNYPQVQRYADNQFYAFTRGTTFVALTNGGSNQPQIVRNITYQPYPNGTRLCNLFYSQDCITVQNGAFSVYLDHGECKVFSPA